MCEKINTNSANRIKKTGRCKNKEDTGTNQSGEIKLNENVGTVHPLKRFPEELWRMIWNDMEDPLARLNLLKSHEFFEDLFDDGKQNWLFPAVLQHVLPRLKPSKLTEKEENLIAHTFLNLRLVSRSCCKAVDKCADRHWEDLSFPPLDYFSTPNTFDCRLSIFRFIKQVEEEHLHNRRNPLIRRSIQIRIEEEEEGEDFSLTTTAWNPPTPHDVLALLNTVGKYLRKINFHLIIKNYERSAVFLSKVFSAAPNLQELHLYLVKSYGNDTDKEKEIEAEAISLPNLPKLTNIFICGAAAAKFTEYFSFSKYLMQLNSFMGDFQFFRKTFLNKNAKKSVKEEEKFCFPNLTNLQLCCFPHLTSEDSIRKVYSDASDLIYLKLDAPKLKNLTLHGIQFKEIGSRFKEMERNGHLTLPQKRMKGYRVICKRVLFLIFLLYVFFFTC